MAIRNPQPNSVNSRMAVSRLVETSVSTLPAGYVRYAYARRDGPPHAPAQLMQLRQPHAVGVLDNQGVRVRDIHAGFDDGGADQNVDLVLHQPPPDLGQLLLRSFCRAPTAIRASGMCRWSFIATPSMLSTRLCR